MLHDKGAATATRVGFTATRNLPTTDPDKALRCMSWLSANAHNVRQAAVAAAAKAAGMGYADYVRRANPFRGRQGSKPVYTLSLAWHPTKDRTPSRADMLKAADEVLTALGLEDRQALIVQHTDTAHPHVHLIVNRISPINGKYASVSNDWLKLSWWAMQHERKTGFILCHERVFNWEQRHAMRADKAARRKADPQAKGRYVRHKQTPRGDHDWFRAHAHLDDEAIRQARADRQQKELRDFALRQTRFLARIDARLRAGPGRDLDALRKHREARQAALDKATNRHGPQAIPSLFAKVAALLSPRRFIERRAIGQMIRAEDKLTGLIDQRHKQARDKTGELWRRLEARHAAERRRDEERIAARARSGRSDAAASRARTNFAVRGQAETGRNFAAAKALPKVAAKQRKAADPNSARTAGERHQLERLSRKMGGGPVASDTSLSQVRPHAPADILRPSETVKQTEIGSDHSKDAEQTTRSSSERDDRIAKRVRELEAADRQRRKRHRPRGKTRKLE
ncbi:relaxase/mobilization nuclease domain-containing protein [Zhengella mangrovi]|nr:relaxase/mobilization nuclease domain-containing protein [Zhengella mangrovi]